MNKTSGIIFDIQRYCIHDGSGIRTNIFLKGCPLKCLWCANPESQNMGIEFAFFKKKCIGDKYCIEICPKGALSMGASGLMRDSKKCDLCQLCEKSCYSEAIAFYGKEQTVDYVLKECLKDKDFYNKSKGGITLSGGEPFAQYDFSYNLLKAFKKENISTAVETTGYISTDKLIRVLPCVDVFLYDLKGINKEKHIKNTGVDNELILDNLRLLSKSKKEIIIRVPVIPRFNNSENDINQLITFIKSLDNVHKVDLLPYHRLGVFKYEALNKEYSLKDTIAPSVEDMNRLKTIFEKNDIVVQIGG